MGGIVKSVGNAVGDVLGGAANAVGGALKNPIVDTALAVAAPEFLPALLPESIAGAVGGLGSFASPLLTGAIQLATTGKINPLSLAASAIPGLQFDPNATGIMSAIPTGWGGVIGSGGPTLGSTISNSLSNLFSPSGVNSTSGIASLNPLGGGSTVGGSPISNFDTSGMNFDTSSGLTNFGSSVSANMANAANATLDPITGNVNTVGGLMSNSNYPLGGSTGFNTSAFDITGSNVPTANVSPKDPGFLSNLKATFNSNSLPELGTNIMNTSASALKAMFTKGDSLNTPAVLAALSLIPSYMSAKQKASQLGIPFDYNTYVANKVTPIQQKYAAQAPVSSFVKNPQPSATGGYQSGGRVHHAMGNMVTGQDPRMQLLQAMQQGQGQNQGQFNPAQFDQWRQRMHAMQDQTQQSQAQQNQAQQSQAQQSQAQQGQAQQSQNRQDWMRDMQTRHGKFPEMNHQGMAPQMAKHGGRIGYADGKLVEPQTPSRDYRPMQLIQTFTDAKSRGDEDTANLAAHSLWSEYKFNILPGKKEGGRIKKNMGGTLGQPEIYTPTQDTMMSRNIPNEGLMSIKLTPVNKKKGGKIIQHPVRMLEDGHPELDLRAKGGYIPIGKKERADDVPAMLSKNEFVFTADAVRNAGDGDVNKGAQKMYKLMKSLEGKIKRHG